MKDLRLHLQYIQAKSNCDQIHCCFSKGNDNQVTFTAVSANKARHKWRYPRHICCKPCCISLTQSQFHELMVKSKFLSLSSDFNFDYNCCLMSRHSFLSMIHHWGICRGFARKLFSKCITEQPNRDVPLLTLLEQTHPHPVCLHTQMSTQAPTHTHTDVLKCKSYSCQLSPPHTWWILCLLPRTVVVSANDMFIFTQ